MKTSNPLTVISLIIGDSDDKVRFSQSFGLTTEIEYTKAELLKKPLGDFLNLCKQGINYSINENETIQQKSAGKV